MVPRATATETGQTTETAETSTSVTAAVVATSGVSVCVCVYYLIEFNQCPLSFCDEQSFAATSGDTQSALLCTCLLCLHYELFRLPANVQRWWRWWWRGGSNQIVKYLDSDAAAAAAAATM